MKTSVSFQKRLALKLLFLGLLFLLLWPIQALAGVETEPNDKLGQANSVVSAESMLGTFGFAGDVDWYKITLDSPGRLQCSVTRPPATIRASISLYNRHADNLYVYNAAVNDGDDVHLIYDVTEPGTYFIRLHDRDNHFSENSYTFTAVFTPVVDAHEPNNHMGQATSIQTTDVAGTIFDRSDVDFYRIYVESGATLRVQINSPAPMRTGVNLYSPDLTNLYVSAQAVNPGDPVTLEHPIVPAGLYYIRVHDILGQAHLTPYSMTVTGGVPGYIPEKTPVTSEAEDNGSLGNANAIRLETAVSGTIAQPGDKDWYRFDVPGSGQLRINLNSVPSDLQLRFALHNGSGTHLVSGHPTKIGETFSLSYDVSMPDTFFLRIEDIDNTRASSGTYAFSTQFTAVNDPYEPNDNYGDARSLNELNRINAYIFKTGDQDWYRVTTSAAAPLQVILSDLPGNITPELAVYNNSKEYLAGKTGAPGMDMELNHTVPGPGTYYIRVQDAGNNDTSTSPYTLTIHGAEFTAYAPTARIDRIDPGSIVAGDQIRFSGSGIDSDGTITAYAWRSSIDGDLSSEPEFFTDTLSMGTHTIYFKVQDNDGIWSTEVSQVVYVGNSISDELEPNDLIGQANEIALDRPVLAKITQAGDLDFFKIYISRPGRLTVTVTNVPENLRLALNFYNRHLNNLYIYNHANQDGDSVPLTMNITEPGFHYLRIHDRDNDFNADFTYTLKAGFIEAADPQGNNDSMLDVHDLTSDTVQGFLFPEGDQDWFRVWVDAGQTLGVSMSDTPPRAPALYQPFRKKPAESVCSDVFGKQRGQSTGPGPCCRRSRLCLYPDSRPGQCL
jgi:hypothetical protein